MYSQEAGGIVMPCAKVLYAEKHSAIDLCPFVVPVGDIRDSHMIARYLSPACAGVVRSGSA